MRYYIGKNGQQLGPFDAQQVREQLAAGAVSPQDLVWREGMAAWAPLQTEFPSSDAPPAPPPVPSPFAHTAGNTGAHPGNPFVSDVTRETVAEEPQLAGRGTRLGAVLLDGLVNLLAVGPGLAWFFTGMVALSNSGASMPEEPDLAFFTEHFAGPLLAMLVPLLIVLVLQVWLLSTRGQTLGKVWLKIRIVRTDGTAPGFVHAVLLRSFVMQLIGAIPLVGGIVSLVNPLMIFREDRRCLHDLIADTAVIDA
jgi:uncharacterized RDD family membrane protein YckC